MRGIILNRIRITHTHFIAYILLLKNGYLFEHFWGCKLPMISFLLFELMCYTANNHPLLYEQFLCKTRKKIYGKTCELQKKTARHGKQSQFFLFLLPKTNVINSSSTRERERERKLKNKRIYDLQGDFNGIAVKIIKKRNVPPFYAKIFFSITSCNRHHEPLMNGIKAKRRNI